MIFSCAADIAAVSGACVAATQSLAACSAAALSRAMASTITVVPDQEDSTGHRRGGEEHQARADTGHPSSPQTRRTTVCNVFR